MGEHADFPSPVSPHRGEWDQETEVTQVTVIRTHSDQRVRNPQLLPITTGFARIMWFKIQE